MTKNEGHMIEFGQPCFSLTRERSERSGKIVLAEGKRLHLSTLLPFVLNSQHSTKANL